jgi:hypothetical protein
LAFTSCAKEVNNHCTLTKVYENGSLVTEYFLNNGRLSRIEQYDPITGFITVYWLLTWDELGRLDYVDYYNSSGVLVERSKITRNADGNVGRVYYYTDSNNDQFPESLTGYLEYIYDGNKHITEEKHYDAPSNYTYSEFYTWMGDNLVRKDNLTLGSAVYAYDDKKPMYGSYKELFFVFFNPAYLSANNVVSISTFDTGNNPLGTSYYSLTYNAEGYPDAETSYQQDYEYHCEAE